MLTKTAPTAIVAEKNAKDFYCEGERGINSIEEQLKVLNQWQGTRSMEQAKGTQ